MAFLDIVKEVITNKPVHLKSPYFMKVDSDLKTQLEKLKEILPLASAEDKPLIEQDIKNLEAGRIGEENVAFELKNSYMPIIVLHDLYLEHEGLTAQIDYLVLTTKYTLVIECKNLFGDIEVNSNGDFIRTMTYNGKTKREGIYSPITQNSRHMELIKAVRAATRGNFITRALLEKYFNDNYKSVVVLANPKSVINLKYAKKEIKNQIIRCDQLIEHMKKLYAESKNESYSEKHIYDLAEFFVRIHKPNPIDYTKKYVLTEPKIIPPQTPPAPVVAEIVLEDTPLYQDLKKYRLEKSREEGIAAFYIYNNEQMKALITAMPGTLADLIKINGFNETKCQKHGQAILEIIGKHK